LGLVGLGLWLGSKFGGFGLGDGFGLGKGPGTGASKSSEGSTEGRPDGSGRYAVGLTGLNQPNVKPLAQPERILVIIDGHRLMVADSSDVDTGQELTATEIAERVKQATGDDQGIRIRIERTKRAQAGAQSELRQALSEAGIKKEEIQEMTGFLD
jgi:hypothetical protein